MYKKFLSLLLSLLMIVSSSLCVVAEGEDNQDSETNISEQTGGAEDSETPEPSLDSVGDEKEEIVGTSEEAPTPSTETNESEEDNNEIEYSGGYIASEQDYNTPVYEPYFELYSNEDLSSFIPDLTKYPSVRNQNPYGTCWAHTAIGLTEFDLINDEYANKEIDLSELQLAYYTYNFVTDPLGGTVGDVSSYKNEGDTNYLQKGGNLLYTARRLMQWISPVSETQVPYSNASSTLTSGLNNSNAYNKTNYHLANVYLINIKENTDQLKQQIISHGAAGVAYYHDLNNYSKTDNKTDDKYVFYDTGVAKTNHAVMIVGWNDKFSKENFPETNRPSSDGAWLIRNSWGENNYEYFWISYETSSLTDTAYIYDFVENDGLDNNYQLDGGTNAGWTSATHVANVFSVSAKDDADYELLSAVSLSLTHSANVGYKIEVYTDLKDASNPLSGTLQSAATTEGETAFAGMYTIDLEKSVELKPNTSFSIIVTLSDGSKMDVEYGDDSDANWTSTVSNNEKSFYIGNYDYSGKGYKAVDSDKGNFCIKAYTSNVKEYTVTYNLDGGANSEGNPEKINSTDSSYTLKDPTKTGYTFLGWYDSDNNKVETLTPSKNYALTAKWQVNTYTITYANMDDATNASSNPSTVTYESGAVTLGNPTKTNFEFKGWYSDKELKNKVTEIPAHLTENYTVYAKWEKVVYKYTITYNLDGGTNSKGNPAGTTSDSEEIKLADPVKDGYRFDGWYTDANYSTKIESIPANPTSNYTLYAKWTQVYKVTYAYKYENEDTYGTPSNVEGLPKDSEYAKGEKVTIPSAPTSSDKNAKDGTRGAWECTWDVTTDFEISSDTTITGTWTFTPVNNQGRAGYYLVADGATWTKTADGNLPDGLVQDETNTNKYFYKNKLAQGDTFTVTSSVPVREGYVFIGWFDKDRKVDSNTTTATIRKAGDTVKYLYPGKDYSLDALWATLNVTGSTTTYDGTNHTLTDELVIDYSNDDWKKEYSETALKNITVGDTEYSTKTVNNGVWSTTKPEFKDAGTYTVKVRKTVTVGENKTTLEKEANVVIKKATLTVTTPNANKVYDGEALTAEGSINGFVNDEDKIAKFSTTGTITDVGEKTNTYSINWDTVNKDNYDIKESLGTLTVTAASGLTISASSASKVYDGAALSTTVTAYVKTDNDVSVASNALDDEIIITYSIDDKIYQQAPSITNVGKLEVKVKATKANYQPAEASYTLEVTKRPVTFTGESGEKTYTGEEFNLTGVTVSSGEEEGLVGNVTHNVIASAKGTDANTYNGTITDKNDVVIKDGDNVVTDNYEITTVPGKLTIKKATGLDLQVENGEKTYDGTPLSTTAKSSTYGTKIEYSTDGVNYSEDVPSITYVSESKTIKVRATNPNYETVTKEYKLTINKRDVTFIGNSDTKTYTGDEIKIEGFTVKDSDSLKGSTSSNVSASASGKTVGKHEGTITDAKDVVIKNGDKDVTANYNISTKPGTLTISARPIVDIQANDANKVYDATPLYAEATSKTEGAIITYSTDGGETYSSTVPSITDVGGMKIIALASKDGYESKTIEYVVYVSQRLVTFTGEIATKSYSGQLINLTGVTVSSGEDIGLVGGATHNVVASASGTDVDKYTGTITAKEDVKITMNGDDVTDNYNITTTAGSLTIDPLKVNVTIAGNKKSLTYDGLEHTLEGYTVSIDNDVYKEDYIKCDSEFTVSGKNADKYQLKIEKKAFSNTKTKNFDVTFKVFDGLLEIKKAPLTITTPSASKVYDGKPLTAEGSIKGLVDGEEVDFKTTGSQTKVGSSDNTFTLDWKDVDPNNYSITKYVGKLTVSEVKAPETKKDDSSSDIKVVTCEEAMNSKDWTWSESKKACVYKVSNTKAK